MFNEIGVLYVDHVAVTTNYFEETIAYYLTLPSARLINGPGNNAAQNVKFAFISVANMGIIEVLAPLNDQSPLFNHLKQGGGAYHFCYAVENLDAAVQLAIEKGAKLISPAKSDDAFYGRSVAFLLHPYLGLFELLEAYPSYLASQVVPYFPVHQSEASVIKLTADQNIKKQVFVIFNRVMKANFSEEEDISMQTYLDWDSVKHILLMMELENSFDIQVPSELFSKLISINDIVDFLSKKIL